MKSSKKYYILCIAVLLLVACGKEEKKQAPQMPPAPVVLMEIERKDVPITYSFPAQLSGVQSVEVIARVEGTLLKQYYSNGKNVRSGESLFLIDPSTYQAQVKEREAQLKGAESQYSYTKSEYERIKNLYEQEASSKAQYEQAYSAFQSAVSQRESARQALDIAKINLSYTKVFATASGLAQKSEYTIGSYIKAGSVLTTIAGVDTLYVNFALPAKRHQQILSSLSSGLFALNPTGYTTTITRANGEQHGITATVDFIGSNINITTNTIPWRAIVDNSSKALLPGELVTVELSGLTAKNVVTIPQQAIIAKGPMNLVWLIGEGNIAQIRPIVIGDQVGRDVIVLQGLEVGDKIIVEGVLKARPGGVVMPIPAGNSQLQGMPQGTGGQGGRPQGTGQQMQGGNASTQQKPSGAKTTAQ